jgi:hypothetical protein
VPPDDGAADPEPDEPLDPEEAEPPVVSVPVVSVVPVVVSTGSGGTATGVVSLLLLSLPPPEAIAISTIRNSSAPPSAISLRRR